jgi:CobQ-like glutamine amidotransferase family enzyme
VTRELTILSLYPRQLGINGDSGNVLALLNRAAWRGITSTVVSHDVGDELPDSVDLVHIGSGPRTAQVAVQEDLARIAPRLRDFKAAGVPFLAVAGGWQLLGTEIVTEDGTVVAGAGILPSSTRLVAKRAVGEVVLRGHSGSIAGFENHGGVTTLAPGATPLGTIVAGHGNAGVASASTPGSAVDGVVDGDSIGTNLHGPFLPMNPEWADRMLRAALSRRGFGTDLTADPRITLVDNAASRARDAIAARLGV